MKHTVFAPDALFSASEAVTEPGRLEVQRPIRVVPFADITPGMRRHDFPDDRELLRRLEALVQQDEYVTRAD